MIHLFRATYQTNSKEGASQESNTHNFTSRICIHILITHIWQYKITTCSNIFSIQIIKFHAAASDERLTSCIWYPDWFSCLLYYGLDFFNALGWIINIMGLPASSFHHFHR